MTIDKPSFPNLNPEINAELFVNNPNASFWVGLISPQDYKTGELYDSVGRFRANVYVREQEFLPANAVDACGREYDSDDDRSTQFVVAERIQESDNSVASARIVGYGRLIVKECQKDLLPIEKQFVELFENNPASPGSTEVSRFISRHEDNLMQHFIGLSVIRAMTHFSLTKNIDTAYFEIESHLLKMLRYIGLPLEQLSEPKEVLEVGGLRRLYPIRITPNDIIDAVGTDTFDSQILSDFFANESSSHGLGFYPNSLTNQIEGVSTKGVL
jgi:N-acyl-L-homoserine lactone synthetase